MMPPKTSVDPYTAARSEWTERYSDFIYATIYWRRVAFAAIGIAALLAVGLIIVSAQTKTKLFVVRVDDLGTIAGAGELSDTNLRDADLYRAHLETFLRNWRSVLGDKTAQKGFVERAHAATRGAGLARLQDAYGASSPFDVMEKRTVEVEVSSVIDRGEHTFEIIWRERSRALDGRAIGVQAFRGLFEVEHDPEAKPDFNNPLPIFVTNISFAEVRR